MPLQKETISLSFAEGRDGKSDPWQIPLGKFYRIKNQVYSKYKRLTKRNGYQQIGSVGTAPVGLSTFQGGLCSIGNATAGGNFNAFANSTSSFLNQANYQALGISTQNLIRSNANQFNIDVVTSSSGMTCVTYAETYPSGSAYTLVVTWKYAIFDSSGACIVKPTIINPTSGFTNGVPRVFILGNYFMVCFTANLSSVYHLQYIAIPITSPTAPVGPTDIATVSNNATLCAWDGVVANNSLYLAWDAASSAGIQGTFIHSSLVQDYVVTLDATHQATAVSVTADTTGTLAVWVSFYNSATSAGYSGAYDQNLSSLISARQIISSGTITNLTSSAQNSVNTVLYEVQNSYTLFDGPVQSNYIMTNTISQSGTVGTASTLIRGMGLASKSFLVNGSAFVLGVYASTNQNTYFVLNGSGQTVGKIAYASGGGYISLPILPSALVSGQKVTIGYLYADLIETYNKTPGSVATSAVYSQTGINAATLNFAQTPTIVEIGGALHISGGQLWMYDGTNLVEHGYHLWPEPIKLDTGYIPTPMTPTGTTAAGSFVITSVSSLIKVAIGMSISGTGIPTGSIVTAVNSSLSTITINNQATANGTVTLTIGGSMWAQPDGATNTNAYSYQVLYEWMDAQGYIHRSAPSIPISVTTSGTAKTGAVILYIPTLRATLKNNVKILVFRWSVAQQTYYQVTSTSLALTNSTTADYIAFADTATDAQILGASILYTTGGVVENIGAPASNLISQYDGRLWLVPSETPNTPWFSQTVIPGTPVEMSNLLTYTVPPTRGAQGDIGSVSAVSPMDDKFVLFKSNGSLAYLSGTGPGANGQNSNYSSAPIPINSAVTCSNPQIAIFPEGILFQSDKGIWALRRDLTTQYVGAPVEDFNSQTVLSALTIPNSTHVRLTMSGGTILMYDFLFDQWGTFEGPRATLSTLFQGLHTYVDSSGRVFQETPGTYYDGPNPVLVGFTTGWIAPAGLQGFQRAYAVFLLGRYLSPHKLTVGVAYDYNPTVLQEALVTPDNYSGVYGSDATDGASAVYGGAGDVEQWQINFKQGQCQSFQLTVTETFDSSKGVSAGAGLTISGLELLVGLKKKYPRNLPASRKTG